MTKKGQYWFNMFLAHKGRTIYDVYSNPSYRKVSIWETNFARQKICPTVLGHSCQVFTVGYLEKNDYGKLAFCVDTYGGYYQFGLNAAEIQLLKEAGIYGI